MAGSDNLVIYCSFYLLGPFFILYYIMQKLGFHSYFHTFTILPRKRRIPDRFCSTVGRCVSFRLLPCYQTNQKLDLTMSFAYSTLAGHEPRLPMFVTPLYQPYPLPPRSRRNRIRNLTSIELKNMAEEMASLSEEEYDYDNEVCCYTKEYDKGYLTRFPFPATNHSRVWIRLHVSDR